VPEEGDNRPVRKFATFTEELHRLADWLSACSIKTVAMESTGVYWIALFQILERRGLEVCLVNARHVKGVPGRTEALSGLRRPFARFAAFCAIATPCSRAPRAKCCSCKRPSPR
jgi:hypothetical protein